MQSHRKQPAPITNVPIFTVDDSPVNEVESLANSILKKIDELPADDSELDPFVYFESQASINALRKLLNEPKSSNIISAASLKPFFDFISERGKVISQTNATYHTNPETRANLICQFMLTELRKAVKHRIPESERTNWLDISKEPGKTLLPDESKENKLDARMMENKILPYAYQDLNTREELIERLLILSEEGRKKFLQNLKQAHLISLMTKDKAVDFAGLMNMVTNKSQVDELFFDTSKQEENLAISACLFESYMNDRMEGPQYKSTTAAVRGFVANHLFPSVGKVPDMKTKIDAAFEGQACVIYKEKLNQLAALDSHSRYGASYSDNGTLQKIWIAIKAHLPAAQLKLDDEEKLTLGLSR